MSRRRALAGGAAVLLLGVRRVVAAAIGDAPVIDPDVRTAVVHGSVRVLVEFRLPGAPPEGGAPGSPGRPPQEQVIAAARQSVLARLSGTTHRVVRQYSSVPLVALEIGADALRVLETMGDLIVRVRAERVRPPSAFG